MVACIKGDFTDKNATDFFQQQWPAFLEMEFTSRRNSPNSLEDSSIPATYLAHSRHKGPLYLQKPFYPEGAYCAHAYLLHPPGGLCSGDDLQISVQANDHANVVITSPGAMRLYKARKPAVGQGDSVADNVQLQKVFNRLRAQSGSSIEWLPMETIVYPAAFADLHTDIELDADSYFVGWEVVCLGLPASEAFFTEGRLRQTIQITINNRPVLIDRFQFDQPHLLFDAACGLKRRPVSGVMLAGPFAEMPSELMQSLQEKLHIENGESMASVTFVNQFLIVRYLGHSSYSARKTFISCWKLIRPYLLNRKASMPAIWRT